MGQLLGTVQCHGEFPPDFLSTKIQLSFEITRGRSTRLYISVPDYFRKLQHGGSPSGGEVWERPERCNQTSSTAGAMERKKLTAEESAQAFRSTVGNHDTVVEQRRKFGKPMAAIKTTVQIHRSYPEEGSKRKSLLPQRESWIMKKLMTTLDTVIDQEEEIEQSMPKRRETYHDTAETPKRAAAIRKGHTPLCFYYGSQEHWSFDCTKIVSPEARLECLKRANRCMGCGAKKSPFCRM
ncbi:unnamed protein product [Haemonchus placei]|uniref:CCHC-type domain-containing protein n=1 Tax=Haemonchus placei TaxID=6290 RepID=A0A0N4WRB1_HAEPC|nr:unnamed protein product [Haemonchus placei]